MTTVESPRNTAAVVAGHLCVSRRALPHSTELRNPLCSFCPGVWGRRHHLGRSKALLTLPKIIHRTAIWNRCCCIRARKRMKTSRKCSCTYCTPGYSPRAVESRPGNDVFFVEALRRFRDDKCHSQLPVLLNRRAFLSVRMEECIAFALDLLSVTPIHVSSAGGRGVCCQADSAPTGSPLTFADIRGSSVAHALCACPCHSCP